MSVGQITFNNETFDLGAHASWEPAKVHRFLAGVGTFVREVNDKTPSHQVADTIGQRLLTDWAFQASMVRGIFGGDRHFRRLGRRDAGNLCPLMKLGGMDDMFGTDEAGNDFIREIIPNQLLAAPFAMTKIKVDPERPTFDQECEGVLIKGVKKDDQPYYLKRKYESNGIRWGINIDEPDSAHVTLDGHGANSIAHFFERLHVCATRVLHHNGFITFYQDRCQVLAGRCGFYPSLQRLVMEYSDPRTSDYPSLAEQDQAEQACEREELYELLYWIFFKRTLETIFADQILVRGKYEFVYTEKSQPHNGRFKSREEIATIICDYADLSTTPAPVAADELLPELPCLQLEEPKPEPEQQPVSAPETLTVQEAPKAPAKRAPTGLQLLVDGLKKLFPGQ